MPRYFITLYCIIRANKVIMVRGIPLKASDIGGIAYLCKENYSNRHISDVTGVPIRTVQHWTKRFRDNGFNDIEPLHRLPPGPKPKLGEMTLRVLKREVDKSPRISARQLKERNPDLLSHVSLRTIRRVLQRDLHYKYRCAWKKPIVTRRQMKNRVAFSKKGKDWTIAKYKTMLWSDESTFTVTSNRSGKVRRRPGSDPLDPKYVCGTVKHPDKIMVWGCFGYYGKGKLIVLPKNETVNKEVYLDLLSEHLSDCFQMCRIPFSTGTFMQDGASCHTAKLIKNWFDWVGIDYIKDWPGNSPDLNPIENLWSIMKEKLKERDTSSVPKLEAAVRDIWENIDISTLQNLALSVHDRFNEVIARQGRPTKY